MKVKGKFDHFNINVTDLEKSIEFMTRHWGCMSLIVRCRKTALLFWFILPMVAADFYLN